MSYDKNSQTEKYSFPEYATFGATSVVRKIRGPKGKVGFVRDIAVEVTTSLVGTTTVPEVQVGTASGDFTYGRFRLGTTAILGYTTGIRRASAQGLTGNPPRTLADFAGHVVLDGGPLTTSGSAGGSFSTVAPAGRIPADTDVFVTLAAGVGGTPAGGGIPSIEIDWI